MARQTGNLVIEGTIEELTFYKMEGKYYVRMKSSLTGKRFWKDSAFEGSRKSSSRFAEGNRLASRVYRRIEEEKRVYTLYCFLKKRAIQLLKEGKSLSKAETLLIDYLVDFGLIERADEKKAVKDRIVAAPVVNKHKVLPKVQTVVLLVDDRDDPRWMIVRNERRFNCRVIQWPRLQPGPPTKVLVQRYF